MSKYVCKNQVAGWKTMLRPWLQLKRWWSSCINSSDLTNVPSKLCVCTQALRRVHTRKHTWERINVLSKNAFSHIFHTSHSKSRWVQVKCCTKTFYVHRLYKIWGNIAPNPTLSSLLSETL